MSDESDYDTKKSKSSRLKAKLTAANGKKQWAGFAESLRDRAAGKTEGDIQMLSVLNGNIILDGEASAEQKSLALPDMEGEPWAEWDIDVSEWALSDFKLENMKLALEWEKVTFAQKKALRRVKKLREQRSDFKKINSELKQIIHSRCGKDLQEQLLGQKIPPGDGRALFLALKKRFGQKSESVRRIEVNKFESTKYKKGTPVAQFVSGLTAQATNINSMGQPKHAQDIKTQVYAAKAETSAARDAIATSADNGLAEFPETPDAPDALPEVPEEQDDDRAAEASELRNQLDALRAIVEEERRASAAYREEAAAAYNAVVEVRNKLLATLLERLVKADKSLQAASAAVDAVQYIHKEKLLDVAVTALVQDDSWRDYVLQVETNNPDLTLPILVEKLKTIESRTASLQKKKAKPTGLVQQPRRSRNPNSSEYIDRTEPCIHCADPTHPWPDSDCRANPKHPKHKEWLRTATGRRWVFKGKPTTATQRAAALIGNRTCVPAGHDHDSDGDAEEDSDESDAHKDLALLLRTLTKKAKKTKKKRKKKKNTGLLSFKDLLRRVSKAEDRDFR